MAIAVDADGFRPLQPGMDDVADLLGDVVVLIFEIDRQDVVVLKVLQVGKSESLHPHLQAVSGWARSTNVVDAS